MKTKQTEIILAHLKTGRGITQLEALTLYGVGRLASRIHDLKAAGYEITAQTVKVQKANGETANVCEYRLKGGE